MKAEHKVNVTMSTLSTTASKYLKHIWKEKRIVCIHFGTISIWQKYSQ